MTDPVEARLCYLADIVGEAHTKLYQTETYFRRAVDELIHRLLVGQPPLEATGHVLAALTLLHRGTVDHLTEVYQKGLPPIIVKTP